MEEKVDHPIAAYTTKMKEEREQNSKDLNGVDLTTDRAKVRNSFLSKSEPNKNKTKNKTRRPRPRPRPQRLP